MAETSTIFGFMKYVSATDILSDFKKTVDSHFVNSLKGNCGFLFKYNFQRIHAYPWLIDQSFLYQDKPYVHLDIHQL